MIAEPGQVVHFSEDPTIVRFEPHVAATSAHSTAYVWAVDAARCPDYWFPRQCPRAMAWINSNTDPLERVSVLGAGTTDRVHAVEYGWLEAIRATRLYAYRFAGTAFAPISADDPHAMVSAVPVEALGPPEMVDNLLDLHERAGIELRVLPNLWPFWDRVVGSSLGHSGIRLCNARRRPEPTRP